MAELQSTIQQNGQELRVGDFNTAAESAGLADDRVLADALRLALDTGSGVAKAILPYGTASDNAATVSPSGVGDAKVNISPFRAVVGSRTSVTGTTTADAMKAWRDVRSAVFANGDVTAATPATSTVAQQTIAANSSGNARWDVIYAIVSPDAIGATGARAVKASTGGAVTTPTVTTQFATKCSLGYAQGTPSASPAFPSLPADTSTVFYVALAYVLVPDGFGASSQVKTWQICPVASPGPSALTKGFGAANLSVANAIVQSTSALAAWANDSDTSTCGRPSWAMTPETRGREDLLVAVNVPGSNTAFWSHVSGALIDNSRSWANRVFKITIFAGTNGPPASIFAWSRASPIIQIIPSPQKALGTPDATNTVVQFGQSFIADGTYVASTSTICFVDSTSFSQLSAGVGLYVDSSGAMRVYIDGTANNCNLFFWVESSGAFASY